MDTSPDTSEGETPDIDPRWDGAFIPIGHWHFHRNLLARYGIVLQVGEYSRIIADIESGRALLVKEMRDGSNIYCARVQSAKARVFVLAYQRNIITAWPPDKKLNAMRRAITAANAATADVERAATLEPT